MAIAGGLDRFGEDTQRLGHLADLVKRQSGVERLPE